MTLRSPRERLIQTLAYEAGGLAISIPLYLLYSGSGASEGALVMAALSLAVMLWSPLHNTAFDWADLRLTGRLASDRPHRWRLFHAVSHEVSTVKPKTPMPCRGSVTSAA